MNFNEYEKTEKTNNYHKNEYYKQLYKKDEVGVATRNKK